ncbi:MAG: HNH endonuclease signature motif containing protein [Ilumatobacteraceae bacterium]
MATATTETTTDPVATDPVAGPIFDGFGRYVLGVAALTDTELDDLLRANELEQRRLTAERAALLTAIEHRHLWAAEHRSMTAYLRATLNCSTATASRERRRAQLLHLHPELGDTVHAGHIAIDQIDEITRIHTNPRIGHLLTSIIDVLTDLAEHTSHHEFRTRITQLIGLLDQDGTLADLDDAVTGRRATVTEVAGTLAVSAHGGDPIQAAQLQAIFDAFVEHEHRTDLATRRTLHGDTADQHPLPRTHQQRSFDALAAIFAAAHTNPAGRTLPTTIVNIVVDATTVHDTLTHAQITLSNRNTLEIDPTGRLDHDPTVADRYITDLIRDPEVLRTRTCTTPAGHPIHPSILLRALLTEHVRRVVIDSHRVITDLGTTRRLFTGSARIAAQLLTDTCTFPGCITPTRWTQVDHDTEHHQHGPTDQHNANNACGHHNRLKHRQRWRTAKNRHGRNYTIRPDDTIILPVGERPPDLTTHQLTRLARQRARQLSARGASPT